MTAYSPDPRDLGSGTRDGTDRATPLARRARYSRWDGTQRLPDLDAGEIMDALSDDVMAEGDLAAALRRLMERGWRTDDPTRPDLAGLRDLMDRLERQRETALERYGLDDVLGDIRRELEDIVADERRGVERRLDDASAPGEDADLRAMLRDVAAKRLDQLDGLPADIGERLRGLQEYDFLEPSARERFEALTDRLRRQVLDQYVAGMSDAIRQMSPEDLDANREMVRDLNAIDPGADRGRRSRCERLPGEARSLLPGRSNLR